MEDKWTRTNQCRLVYRLDSKGWGEQSIWWWSSSLLLLSQPVFLLPWTWHPSISQVTAYIQDQILISESINLFDTESYKRPAKSDRSPTIQCRGEYQWAHNKSLAINQGLCVWHRFIYYAPKHCQYTIHHWRTAWYFRWLVGHDSQEVHAAAPSIA